MSLNVPLKKVFRTVLLVLSGKESFASLGTLVCFFLLDKKYHETIFPFPFPPKSSKKFTASTGMT